MVHIATPRRFFVVASTLCSPRSWRGNASYWSPASLAAESAPPSEGVPVSPPGTTQHADTLVFAINTYTHHAGGSTHLILLCEQPCAQY